RIADERIHQSRRRLQMSHDVYAAKRESLRYGRSAGPSVSFGALGDRLYLLRFARSAASIFASGKQFTTSSLVSQPLRAMPIPNHKSCRRAMRLASGSITHLTPFCLANGHQRQSRSSRLGAALSSTHVPVRAAASSTAGMSIWYGSRFKSKRPVGCARIVTNGFSNARITRLVISDSLKLKAECTDATT